MATPENVDWEEMAKSLWQILDDISTLGDMFKPTGSPSAKAYFEAVEKRCERRNKYMYSPDGYGLVVTPKKDSKN